MCRKTRPWTLFALLFVLGCGSGSDTSHGASAGAGLTDGGRDATSTMQDAGPRDADGFDGGTRPPKGTYVVNETFDAMITGAPPASSWSVATSPAGAVNIAEVPFPGDKSVAVAKPDTTGTTSLGVSFPPQSGRVVVEAKVKAAETGGFKALPYIYDAAGNAMASIGFQDGNIVARIGATMSVIQPFKANEWYRVRVVVDTNAGVFECSAIFPRRRITCGMSRTSRSTRAPRRSRIPTRAPS